MATWVAQLMKNIRKGEHLLKKVENSQYDQFKLSSKLPHNPNIVVINGDSPNLAPLINNCFSGHKLIKSQDYLQKESSSSPSKQIARALIDEYKYIGKVLIDYPRSTEEAQELDLYLEGVNLAIHFEGESLSSEQKAVAAFYQERGLLMTHKVNPSLDVEEQKAIFGDLLMASIKL